jgi:hypothetical protein
MTVPRNSPHPISSISATRDGKTVQAFCHLCPIPERRSPFRPDRLSIDKKLVGFLKTDARFELGHETDDCVTMEKRKC